MSLSPATFYDDNGVVRLQGQLDGGGGGVSPYAQQVTTLQPAQLLAIGGTPVVVVDAPGPTQAVYVTDVFSFYTFATTAYSGAAALSINPPYTGYSLFEMSAQTLLAKTFNAQATWAIFGGQFGNENEYDHTDLAGGAWSVAAPGGSTLADGDGTMTIICTYLTHDLTV